MYIMYKYIVKKVGNGHEKYTGILRIRHQKKKKLVTFITFLMSYGRKLTAV